MFRQAGIVQVDTLEEMFDVAQLLAHQPLPAGGRLAIVGNSTAVGRLGGDSARLQGFTVTQAVDLGAGATPEEFRAAIADALARDEVDSVLTVFVPPVATEPDAYAEAIRAAADLPGAPADVAVGSGSVWVADPDGQRIVRIDVGSGSVSDRIPIPGQPGRLAIGAGAVWVASTIVGRVSRVDPETAELTQAIPLSGARPTDIAFSDGAVWVAESTSRSLIEECQPNTVAFTQSARWVCCTPLGRAVVPEV